MTAVTETAATVTAEPRRRDRRVRSARGSALILALMLILLLSAAGAALLSLATTELRVAAAFRDGDETTAAATAALQVGVWLAGQVASLSDVLDGREATGYVGPTVVVAPADLSRRIDLRVETASIQAQTAALADWGANEPEWRLVANAPLATLLNLAPEITQQYVAVWMADDPEDGDNDPHRDSNGRIWLRSQAYGRSRSARGVEAAVERQPSWGNRVRVEWIRDATR